MIPIQFQAGAGMIAEKSMEPSLRFPQFSEDWEEATVRDLISIIDSGWSPQCLNRAANPNEWGILATTSTTWDGFSGQSNKALPEGFDPKPSMEIVVGDILITRAGPFDRVGVVAHVNKTRAKLMLSDKLIRLRVKPGQDSRFVSRFLGRGMFQRYLHGTKSGLAEAQVNITQDIIEKGPIVFPQISEQRKIADFLGYVDVRVTLLRRRRDALRDYKKGVMQRLFSQELRFTRNDGTAFPAWQEKCLGDVFEEVKPKVGDQGFQTYSISAGIGFVSQKEKFGKDISGAQNPNYTALKPGHFSYNKGNSKTYKYGCVYLSRLDQIIAVPNVFISFERRDSATVSEFYQFLFEHHYLDRGLRRIISSSARMDGLLNVSKANFFKLSIPVPYPDEQTKIADFLSALDTKIDAATAQLDAMKAFKKVLLQQMFV